MNTNLDDSWTTTETFYTSVEANRIGSREGSPIFTIVISVVAGIGFIMNCFVITVLLMTRKLRRKLSVTFLLSQCIMDAVSTANVLIFYFIEYIHVVLKASPGTFYCRAIWSEYLIYVALHAAVWNTVALSGERYMAIAHPMTYKRVASRKKFIPIIATCWMIGLVINAPFISMAKLGDDSCYIAYFLDSMVAQSVYSTLSIVVTYLAPVIMIIYLYVTMVRKLRERTNFAANGSSSEKGIHAVGMAEATQTAQMRLTRTAAALGVAFFVTWTPYNFYLVAYTAGAGLEFKDHGYFFCVTLVMSNAAVNPFIYVFCLEEFRKGVKHLCCRRQREARTETYNVNVWVSTNESMA